MSAISALSSLSITRSMHALASASAQMNTAMERLTTGKKINQASDDPAGMEAAEQMKARIAAINKKIDSIDFNEKYLGAREGAESALSDLLLQLKGDVTGAANKSGLTDAEKQGLQTDADSVIGAINMLSQTTQFNGEQILTGFDASHLGADAVARAQPPSPTPPDPAHPRQTQPANYSLADLVSGGDLNLVGGDLESASKVVDAAVDGVASGRAAIGNQVKEDDSERRQLSTELVNLQSARSDVEDADYATETANLMRAQVLQQVATYVMQLAEKQQADTVLKLIK